mmetsp:Transcript_140640/g.258882  ORF Transcript_140640/g.258882 Transcript_140640/m.258882 type:complete len:279 (-) Transcript_140640:422-1258(-)
MLQPDTSTVYSAPAVTSVMVLDHKKPSPCSGWVHVGRAARTLALGVTLIAQLVTGAASISATCHWALKPNLCSSHLKSNGFSGGFCDHGLDQSLDPIALEAETLTLNCVSTLRSASVVCQVLPVLTTGSLCAALPQNTPVQTITAQLSTSAPSGSSACQVIRIVPGRRPGQQFTECGALGKSDVLNSFCSQSPSPATFKPRTRMLYAVAGSRPITVADHCCFTSSCDAGDSTSADCQERFPITCTAQPVSGAPSAAGTFQVNANFFGLRWLHSKSLGT